MGMQLQHCICFCSLLFFFFPLLSRFCLSAQPISSRRVPPITYGSQLKVFATRKDLLLGVEALVPLNSLETTRCCWHYKLNWTVKRLAHASEFYALCHGDPCAGLELKSYRDLLFKKQASWRLSFWLGSVSIIARGWRLWLGLWACAGVWGLAGLIVSSFDLFFSTKPLR